MGRPRIVGFCGNSRRPSKTRTLVEIVSADLLRRYGCETAVMDLVDAGPGLGAFERSGLSEPAVALIEAIEQADALIIGSPVYQGSYPGLFKHAFDLVRLEPLKSRPVLLTASGGGLRHSLMIEHQLRPLFGFFKAVTMPTAIYASSTEFEGDALRGEITLARIRDVVDQFAGHLGLQRAASA